MKLTIVQSLISSFSFFPLIFKLKSKSRYYAALFNSATNSQEFQCVNFCFEFIKNDKNNSIVRHKRIEIVIAQRNEKQRNKNKNYFRRRFEYEFPFFWWKWIAKLNTRNDVIADWNVFLFSLLLFCCYFVDSLENSKIVVFVFDSKLNIVSAAHRIDRNILEMGQYFCVAHKQFGNDDRISCRSAVQTHSGRTICTHSQPFCGTRCVQKISGKGIHTTWT